MNRHKNSSERRKPKSSISYDFSINKIPDLYMSSSVRLAGEECYFNKTKDLKLEPFKKQKVFETCISPELYCNYDYSIIKSHSQDDNFSKKVNYVKIDSVKEKLKQVKSSQVYFDTSAIKKKKANKVTFYNNTKHRNNVPEKSQYNDYGIRLSNVIKKVMTKHEEEVQKKRQINCDLNRKYSKIKFKKKNNALDDLHQRIGYDKLFCSKSFDDFPFLNPMPSCMLTEDNIDNLREIIISSLDIEWRMLTPVRPENNYEEKYFDKLIYLHRNKYKTRVEFANEHDDDDDDNLSIDRLPFKHTRHSYLFQYGTLNQNQKTKNNHFKSLQFNDKLKAVKRFGKRRKNHLRGSSDKTKINIPKLTLTSDDQFGQKVEEINSIDEAHEHEEEDNNDAIHDNGFGEFKYENFSRFSLLNLEFARKKLAEIENKSSTADYNSKNQSLNLMRNDDLLDDQVDDIMSHLMMNSNMM